MNTTDIINAYNKKIIAYEEFLNLEELYKKYHKLYFDALHHSDHEDENLLLSASTYLYELIERALHTCGRDLKEKPKTKGFNTGDYEVNELKRGFYILISKPRDAHGDCIYKDCPMSRCRDDDIVYIRHLLMIYYGDRTSKKAINVCMKYHTKESKFELFCGDIPVNASEDYHYLARCEVYTVTKETKPISEDELVERLKNFILENTE